MYDGICGKSTAELFHVSVDRRMQTMFVRARVRVITRVCDAQSFERTDAEKRRDLRSSGKTPRGGFCITRLSVGLRIESESEIRCVPRAYPPIRPSPLFPAPFPPSFCPSPRSSAVTSIPFVLVHFYFSFSGAECRFTLFTPWTMRRRVVFYEKAGRRTYESREKNTLKIQFCRAIHRGESNVELSMRRRNNSIYRGRTFRRVVKLY